MIPLITRKFTVKWAFVSSRQITIEKIDKFASYLMRNKNMTVRGMLNAESAEKWRQADKMERYNASIT